jgi:CotH kinase protein/Lamin Tail Domain
MQTLPSPAAPRHRALTKGAMCLALLLGLMSSRALAQVPDFYDIDSYRSIHLKFSQTNYWSQMLQNYSSQTEIKADMTVDNVTYKDVGVRFRGNTSYRNLPVNSEKMSFNIRLDSFVQSQDIYGYDHLNLNNGYHDPTFLREFLTYWICRQHGPAPKVNFVKLYINNAFWGVYINVQQPNKDWAKEWFRSNDGTRYRGFPTSGSFKNGRCAFTWLGTSVSQYLAAYQAKSGDGTDLMKFCNVLNNTPQSQLPTELPKVFNLDQFYRFAACMNLATQTDSYIGSGKDHFLYGDEIHGDFTCFPFDLNEGLAGQSNLSPWFNTTSSVKPAFSKTLVIPEWRQRYKAHYRNIFEDTVNWRTLGPLVTKYHNMIAADVAADTKKIYPLQAFKDNITKTVIVNDGRRNVSIPGLQPLLQARDSYLLGLAEFNSTRATLTSLAHTPATPGAKDTVVVTVKASSIASSVELWWRNVGPFQKVTMYDDGKHGDGAANDGTWGGSIAPQAAGSQIDYYTLASTTAGDMSFSPRNADFGARSYKTAWPTSSSPIRINEFVAQNTRGIVDEKQQYEDWLELYNSASSAVDVSGMWLTDNLSTLKWQIPPSTILPAHGTLLVWCDEDGTQGPMHANFKLSSSGEDIALFSADGKFQLDRIQFGKQTADVSTGRLSDGGSSWVSYPEPSPYKVNELSAGGLRSYTSLLVDDHRLLMGLSAAPKINTKPNLLVSGGMSNGAFGFALALKGTSLPIAGTSITLLLQPLTFVGPLWQTLDAQGAFSGPLAIPNDQALIGKSIFGQCYGVDAKGITASNALEMRFLP